MKSVTALAISCLVAALAPSQVYAQDSQAKQNARKPGVSKWEAVGAAVGSVIGALIGANVGLATGGTGIPATGIFAAGGAVVGAWVGGKLERVWSWFRWRR